MGRRPHHAREGFLLPPIEVRGVERAIKSGRAARSRSGNRLTFIS
jgi:hypothetical protein